LIERLKHQQIDGKIKIALTKVGTDTKVRREYVFSNGSDLLSRFLKGPKKNSGALEPSTPVSSSFSNTSLDSNAPITPVGSRSFLRFLAAAVVLIGVLFFFLYLTK
jgi:hypothetical protein